MPLLTLLAVTPLAVTLLAVTALLVVVVALTRLVLRSGPAAAGPAPLHRGARGPWAARGRVLWVSVVLVLGAGALGALAAQGGRTLATAEPQRPGATRSPTAPPTPWPSPWSGVTTAPDPTPAVRPSGTPRPSAAPTPTAPSGEQVARAPEPTDEPAPSTEATVDGVTERSAKGRPTAPPTQSQGRGNRP